jgi:AraC-like DNA-binding protein
VFGAFFRAARCFCLDGLSPGLLRPIRDQRLARATQAILRDPARDWRLEQLAALSAMSRATFARRFTEAASAFRKGGAAAAAPVDSATTA